MNYTSQTPLIRLLAVFSVLVLGVVSAGAQATFNNVDGANGNWTNPAVWTNGSAPVPGGTTGDLANLSLSNNANVWVTGDVGSAETRQNIRVIGNTGVNATLTISNGTFYGVSPESLRIGFNAHAAATGGQLILDGGNFDLVSPDIRVGNNHGKGLVEVRSGQLTNSGSLLLAPVNSASSALKATLRVTGADASAHFGLDISMGSASASNSPLPQTLMEVSNGGVLTSRSLFMDSAGGTRGTNGTTGSTPNARFVVDGGSYIATNFVRFGLYTNSRATIDVTGGGLFEAQRIETANTASNAQKLLTFNVSNGTLRVSELSLLDAQLNNGGALTIGDGTSASALELLGSANAIVVTNGIAIAANSQLRHTTATNATVASAISGAGSVVKSGAGSLTLSAANTYSGPTTVTGGSLIVNGSVAGATTVSNTGVLSGSGAMGGAVTIGNGGTLAIGNSTGTMTFDNDLTLELNSTSIFEIDGFGAGEFDLALGGTGTQTVTFNGTLSLVFAEGFATEGSVQIFNFENHAGSFASVGFNGLASGYSATFDNLTGTVNVVPEPSTYALLALAGSGLAAHVIRRRRRSN